MKKEQQIKVFQIFESYPLFYQPYIPPIIVGLKEQPNLSLEIIAFKGKSSKDVHIMPSYLKRRILERWYNFINKYKPIPLVYNEILALKKNIDIIHVQHSYLFPKIIGLADSHLKFKPKLVLTLRGTETYAKPWISDKWKYFFRDYGEKLDAFVVMSQHQKTYLKRWGVPENIIEVIPISFGEKQMHQTKNPDTKIIKVVSVFRLCWEKNINANLLVIKTLNDMGYKVEYTLYGDGAELDKLHFLVDKYNLNQCVEIRGRVENVTLKKELKDYDFILQLSHSESLSSSILEAQAIGIPAIVSDSGGLPEAIVHELTGFTVDANDYKAAAQNLIELWQDTQKYKAFSAAAINYANDNFSNEVEIAKWIQLYQKLKNE